MFKSALDNQAAYKNLDTKQIYLAYEKLFQQLESGWHEAEFVNLNLDIAAIKNVCWVGMGGSNIPGKIIKSLAPFIFHLPFEIVSNYRLPTYVDKNTLCILASYSGSTQEVISCAHDAKQRGAKVVAISAGGDALQKICLAEHWPLIKLDEKLNPSKVPRGGIGLILGSSLKLITRLNPASQRILDLDKISRVAEKTLDSLGRSRDTKTNPAKSFADKHAGQGIILIAANHLFGVADAIKNFMNESAKTFCVTYEIPDMNHHLLEGLQFPTSLRDNLKVIIINSDLYPSVIKKRVDLTKTVLTKQKYQVSILKPDSSDPIGQVFESLVFFVLFSYYLSIVNRVDPSRNDWVDYFKNQLTQ